MGDAAMAGGGESAPRPDAGSGADRSVAGTAGGLAEAPGVARWPGDVVSRPGFDERGNIFFAAVEMTRMPMIVTDPKLPDNPIAFANHAFVDLTGYVKEEIVGRNCRFLQGPRTDREAVDEIRAALRERRAISVEILNYRRDGTPFWNALFVGPVFGRDGELLYFFANQLDVTRRRTSEQAFRQSQKMAATGQLTAGLAHEFNNLLQVIVGNLERAADKLGADPARAAQALEQAGRAARHGAKLTGQLLAFARKQRLEPRPVDLNARVAEFVAMLAGTLGDGVELRLDLAPTVPTCVLDPVHLEMALLNLLVNARDATAARDGGGGGGEVTVATTSFDLAGDDAAGRRPGPGGYVALTVRDAGVGMSPEVLRQATEPFFTTKEPGKGTGLGLAMVQGFVQQSRGRLEIESEPGEGATVRMLFPVAVDPAGPAAPAGDEEGERRREEAAGGGTGTILVVEAADDIRALAEIHLGRLGYAVITARGGEEALAVLAREPRVDLLFTAVVLPGGMDGLALAERAREVSPGLPALLTTGYTDELVAEGPPAGGMDVIGKPYRRGELADRVRVALDRGTGDPARPRAGIPHKEG